MRHSGVEFDELVPNLDLFTKLITEYPIKFSIDQEHPMMKLRIKSGGKKFSPKLMQLISNGTVKKVLKLYFVSGQKNKLSNKFLKSVDGCGQLSYIVLSGCFPFMSDLMDMEHEISAKQPLSRGNSIRAQEIILQLCP